MRPHGGETNYCFLLSETFTFIVYFFEMNWLNIEQSRTTTLEIPCFWSSALFRLNFEATWRRKYCFLPSETFTFIFYFFEMNRLRYRTVSYQHFWKFNVFHQAPFLDSTLRPHGGENIVFYLLFNLYTHILLFWDESIEI